MKIRKLRDADESTDRMLQVLILQAYTRKGMQAPGTNELGPVAAELRNQTARLYPALTGTDVGRAMENGVLGVYGEYFGLNIVTFVSWIRSYVASDEYRNTVLERQTAYLALPCRKEPTRTEVDAIMQAAYDKLSKEYARTGLCDDKGNAVYDWLDRAGKISFTVNKKLEFMKRARRELIAENKLARISASPTDGFKIARLLKDYEEQTADAHRSTVVRAKKIALNEYFKTVRP